ncbi:MAG TPA: GNAT family N-acetyltransferase [Caulobacteraceae bacterium]|nr:GNAT family N-acetyltransferase [Caulobacteraceae bacterium]
MTFALPRETVAVPDDDKAPKTSVNFAARLLWTRSGCEAAWRRLQAEGYSTAFQTAVWTDGICEHLAGPAHIRPFFVEVQDRESGEVVMLLPLALSRPLGVRTVNWLNLAVCDYAAPLLAADFKWSPESARAAWAAVRAVLPPVDVIDISQIPPTFAGAVNPLSLLPGRRRMELSAFGIPIRGVEEPIVAHWMQSKPLRELGRRRRRLEEVGEIQFVEAKTPDELDGLFDAMVKQRRFRFEAMGRFDLLSRPHYERFYREAARQSLEDGATARVFGVFVNDELISAAYVLVHAGVFSGILMSIGHDRWGKYGPGLLLVTELMKWSQAQGHRYFDLTIGDMPYKSDLQPIEMELSRMLEATTVVGAIDVACRRLAWKFDAWLQAHKRLSAGGRRLRRALRRMSHPHHGATSEAFRRQKP